MQENRKFHVLPLLKKVFYTIDVIDWRQWKMNELELKLAYLGYLVLDSDLCNNNSDDLLAPL